MILDTCRQSGHLSKFIYTVEYCMVVQKSEPRWHTRIEGFQQYTLEEKLQYAKMMQSLFLFHYFPKQTSPDVCLCFRNRHRCNRHQLQRWQGQGVVATWYQIWGKNLRDPITEEMISKQVPFSVSVVIPASKLLIHDCQSRPDNSLLWVLSPVLECQQQSLSHCDFSDILSSIQLWQSQLLPISC